MRKFEEEMDAVVDALQMAELMLQALPDDSIYELEKTVRAADNMAFMMVTPVEFVAAINRLDDQKKVLEWARNTILVYKSIKTKSMALTTIKAENKC